MIVGVGTALADNPRLTVRLEGEPERHMTRVVIDPALKSDKALKMFEPGAAEHTILVSADDAKGEKAFKTLGARVIKVQRGEGGALDVCQILSELYGLGIMEVFLEGGAATARTFLDAGCVDRVHFFYAPKILGGQNALAMIGGESPAKISDALEVAELEVMRFGPDVYVTGVPVRF